MPPSARPKTGKSSWAAQRGPQAAFVASKVFEVIYGGARGGGKTDAALGEFAIHALAHGENAKGLLVRRTRTALTPTIARARQIFLADGATWNESHSCFFWPSGAVLYFRHLDRDHDADLYQGHDYTRVYVEELTQFPDPRVVDKLKATLRSSAGVPCGFRATCNPGGAGHNWVKARYIEAGEYKVVSEPFENPFDGTVSHLDRVFIPARLADNPKLAQSDPHYVARLAQSGSPELVRAWLEGDWAVVQGAFFSEWSARNILKPFTIPTFWRRLRSFDWGYAAPFSVGWWAVVSEEISHNGRFLPKGALIRYREWYGSTGRPGEGLRMVAETVAAGIKERQRDEQVVHGVADPSIFREDGGPSIAERMRRAGVYWRAADNTRVGSLGAMSGWDQMRARIAGDELAPMLFVFETCRDFIRTVPALQHDRTRPEDLDTNGEDHIADETRYACLSRPLPTTPSEPPASPEWDWDRLRREDPHTNPRWNWKSML